MNIIRLFSLALVFTTFSIQAESITARYPDYNTRSEYAACNDAKGLVKNKVENECGYGNIDDVATSCERCSMKVRFGTKTWTCSGRADYKCKGSEKDSSYTNELRGKVRNYNRSNSSNNPCLENRNSAACNVFKYQQRKKSKTASGVRG